MPGTWAQGGVCKIKHRSQIAPGAPSLRLGMPAPTCRTMGGCKRKSIGAESALMLACSVAHEPGLVACSAFGGRGAGCKGECRSFSTASSQIWQASNEPKPVQQLCRTFWSQAIRALVWAHKAAACASALHGCAGGLHERIPAVHLGTVRGRADCRGHRQHAPRPLPGAQGLQNPRALCVLQRVKFRSQSACTMTILHQQLLWARMVHIDLPCHQCCALKVFKGCSVCSIGKPVDELPLSRLVGGRVGRHPGCAVCRRRHRHV